jgi:hypothetical protein
MRGFVRTDGVGLAEVPRAESTLGAKFPTAANEAQVSLLNLSICEAGP